MLPPPQEMTLPQHPHPHPHTHTLTGEVASPLVSPRKAPTIMEEGEVEGGKEDGGGDTSLLGVALVPHHNHAPPTSSAELATTSLSTALQGLQQRTSSIHHPIATTWSP